MDKAKGKSTGRKKSTSIPIPSSRDKKEDSVEKETGEKVKTHTEASRTKKVRSAEELCYTKNALDVAADVASAATLVDQRPLPPVSKTISAHIKAGADSKVEKPANDKDEKTEDVGTPVEQLTEEEVEAMRDKLVLYRESLLHQCFKEGQLLAMYFKLVQGCRYTYEMSGNRVYCAPLAFKVSYYHEQMEWTPKSFEQMYIKIAQTLDCTCDPIDVEQQLDLILGVEKDLFEGDHVMAEGEWMGKMMRMLMDRAAMFVRSPIWDKENMLLKHGYQPGFSGVGAGRPLDLAPLQNAFSEVVMPMRSMVWLGLWVKSLEGDHCKPGQMWSLMAPRVKKEKLEMLGQKLNPGFKLD